MTTSRDDRAELLRLMKLIDDTTTAAPPPTDAAWATTTSPPSQFPSNGPMTPSTSVEAARAKLTRDYVDLAMRYLRVHGQMVAATRELARWRPVVWWQRATIAALALALVVSTRRGRRGRRR